MNVSWGFTRALQVIIRSKAPNLFRGEEIGDLAEKTVGEMICGDHCTMRYFNEILPFPQPGDEPLPQKFRVVSRHRISSRESRDWSVNAKPTEKDDF